MVLQLNCQKFWLLCYKPQKCHSPTTINISTIIGYCIKSICQRICYQVTKCLACFIINGECATSTATINIAIVCGYRIYCGGTKRLLLNFRMSLALLYIANFPPSPLQVNIAIVCGYRIYCGTKRCCY